MEEEQRAAGSGLTRRRLLIGGGALGVAATLGITATGSPFGGGAQTVVVLAPVRRRRRRAAGADPGGDRQGAPGLRRPRADPPVGQPLLHEARAVGGRRLAARRGGRARHAPPGLRARGPAGGAHAGDARAPRARGRPLPRAAVEELPVRRAPVRDPARHPPVRPLLQHRPGQAGGAARRGREAQVAGRPGRAAGRVRGGQQEDEEAGHRVRDPRRHAVAAVPDAVLADRRRADHHRRRGEDRHRRRQGDQGAGVDGRAQEARRRRRRRRLPGLRRGVRQPDDRLRAQRRVGGHHLPGDEAPVRHAHGAGHLRRRRPTRPTRTRS